MIEQNNDNEIDYSYLWFKFCFFAHCVQFPEKPNGRNLDDNTNDVSWICIELANKLKDSYDKEIINKLIPSLKKIDNECNLIQTENTEYTEILPQMYSYLSKKITISDESSAEKQQYLKDILNNDVNEISLTSEYSSYTHFPILEPHEIPNTFKKLSVRLINNIIRKKIYTISQKVQKANNRKKETVKYDLLERLLTNLYRLMKRKNVMIFDSKFCLGTAMTNSLSDMSEITILYRELININRYNNTTLITTSKAGKASRKARVDKITIRIDNIYKHIAGLTEGIREWLSLQNKSEIICYLVEIDFKFCKKQEGYESFYKENDIEAFKKKHGARKISNSSFGQRLYKQYDKIRESCQIN